MAAKQNGGKAEQERVGFPLTDILADGGILIHSGCEVWLIRRVVFC